MTDFVLRSHALHRAARIGPWQVALASLAIISMGAAGFFYVQNRVAEQQLNQAQARYQQDQATLNQLTERVKEIEALEKIDVPTPEAIRASLVKFQETYLSPAETAQLRAIREVNQLAKQSGVLVTEINFTAIEQRALQGEAEGVKSAKSLFPGLEMSFTVEGSYSSVRQFLASLERSRVFIIVDALELKSVESSASDGRGRQAGAATDQVIALGLKLAVYYQREVS